MPDDHARTHGTWSCVREDVTEPCGDCDGCRQVQAGNSTPAGPVIPPGLLVSVDSRGGFAVPRQLAGHRPA